MESENLLTINVLVCVTACGVRQRNRKSNRGKRKVVGEPLLNT